ncbi:hypothetical protein OF83DRAFT_1051754 [Amylostereum chailletii]|nr:hypothetical protein OF83DRAFT_1051754 [Amylostereum chailletii]
MHFSEHRPASVLVHAAEWQPRSRIDPGHSIPGAPSSYPSSSTSPQRRRSSVLRPPPAAPPPSQPIPSVPPLDTHPPDDFFVPEDAYNQTPGPGSYFARPAASPGLVSVAAFPHTQALQAFSSQMPSPPSLAVNGSASPPFEANSGQHQEIVPDRLLLSPGEPAQTAEPRPSSRRALTRALELAREAVKLDSNNDDPHGAVIAYGKSVALLSKVMERVMRGEDSTESNRKRSGRRRSVVAQEEEVRRLKAIHDTYADRMNILCLIYNISAQPSSPNSHYPSSVSTSTDSTQPSSPVSVSPSSDSSDALSHPSYSSSDIDSDSETRRLSQETARYNGDIFTGSYSVEDLSAPYHPYAAPPQSVNPLESSSHPPPTFSASPPLPSRSSISARPPGTYTTRPRASSTLPPPVPPPQNALPPAPDQAPATQHLNVTSRPRGNSTSSHMRTNSGSRLGLVPEEYDDHALQTAQRHHFNVEEDLQSRPRNSQSTRNPNRDSHPLPALPSPSISSDSSMELMTPRTHPSDTDQLSSPSAKFVTPRPRGSSTVSVRSEMSTSSTLINLSTTMGTIHQRRTTKSSAPPSTGSPSPQPPDGMPSSGLRSSESTTGLPVMAPQPVQYGRSRASSQPGHRPHLNGLPPSAFELPNRPTSSMISGLPLTQLPRKTSFTAKNGSSLPQITVITGAMSPPPTTPSHLHLSSQLVPPPPIPHSTLPTTPTSPLPPMAPTDPMRKPYHMMNLLRHTMTSKSGGYITRRLHVPQEVWSQGGAKLSNLPEKVRVVEVLCSALEELAKCSGSVFGPGNVSSGMGMGIGSVGKKEGEQWSARLEDFSSVCDGVVANFGKKLGVGEGFATKKNTGVTSWGGKLTRQFDKLTSQKNLDSPATYVQGLNRLFQQAQLLDEHCKAITMQPIAPTYAALPADVRMAIDSKLRRSSEFFATVVLTFVIRDLAQLLDKYVKKCEKWLAE